MRIVGVCKQGTANAYYRCMLPLAELERRGHEVVLYNNTGFAKEAHRPFDVLHLQQAWAEDDADLVRRLVADGVGVVWDTDDDISAIPRNSFARFQLGGGRGVKRTFARTVEIASSACLMTTTSEQIASRYRAAGVERVAVIENYLAPSDVAGKPRRHQGIVIGCVAAGEHAADLKGLGFGKLLKQLLNRHDDVRVLALGHDLKIDHPRYTFHRHVPIGELVAFERQFDVGIAPLLDSPLNRARSTVKLKEYAAAGAMWLASPVGPYVGMGEQEGGLLVEDGDWAEALDAVVRDRERRVALRRQAQAWARGQAIAAAGKAWETALRGALLRARQR